MGIKIVLIFDFFKQDNFDIEKLFNKIKNVFKEHKILKIQEEKNTITVLIDNIKFGFFSYQYGLFKEGKDEENLYIALIEDIACMKLSAISSIAINKDYIDLYYIFQEYVFNMLK